MDVTNHVVFLFGSRVLSEIPDVIENHIKAIVEQTGGNVQFVVGDAPGVDAGFQKVLARLGLTSKETVFGMDNIRNNMFGAPEKQVHTEFDPETKTATFYLDDKEVWAEYKVGDLKSLATSPKYYEVKDRLMSNACTFAICYWDGSSKGTLRNVDRLKAQNKYVYVYTAAI